MSDLSEFGDEFDSGGSAGGTKRFRQRGPQVARCAYVFPDGVRCGCRAFRGKYCGHHTPSTHGND